MLEKDLLKSLVQESSNLSYEEKKLLAEHLLEKAKEEEQQELAQLSEEEKRAKQRIKNQAAIDFINKLAQENAEYEEENWEAIEEAINATKRKCLSTVDRIKEEIKTVSGDEKINLLEYLLEEFVRDNKERRNKKQQEEEKQAVERYKEKAWISEDFNEPTELVESKVYEELINKCPSVHLGNASLLKKVLNYWVELNNEANQSNKAE